MPKEEPEVPYVDYTSIPFPSDGLTVAQLQRLYPDLFATPGPADLPDDGLTAAFKEDLRARGVPLPEETDTFLELLRSLPGDSTVGDVRRAHPDQFDVEGGSQHYRALHEGTAEVLDMLWN